MWIKDANHPKFHDFLFKTPTGEAVYPHLLIPDTKFDENGKYKIGIVLKPDEIAAAREALTKIYRTAYPDQTGEPTLPIKTEGERSYIVAKSTYQPKLWDAEGKDLDQPYMVKGGNLIRIRGRARAFKSSFVTGVALYLTGVEIHQDLAELDVFRPGRGSDGASLARPAPTSPAPADDLADIPF